MIGLYILLWGKSKEMQNRLVKLVQEAEETSKEQQEPQPQIQHLTVSCDSRWQWPQVICLGDAKQLNFIHMKVLKFVFA